MWGSLAAARSRMCALASALRSRRSAADLLERETGALRDVDDRQAVDHFSS